MDHRKTSRGAAMDDANSLTSGDVARMLHVDLKTIHNWVKHGHLFGRRTQGRHLRFERTEVARFLRQFDYPIPPRLGRAAPRALLTRPSRRRNAGSASTNGVAWTECGPLLDALVRVACDGQEVLVIDLDGYSPALVAEVQDTIRRVDETRCLGLIGLSEKASRRRTFVRRGGDIALPGGSSARVETAVRWLVGAETELPRGVDGG